jgi:hypothetical protein
MQPSSASLKHAGGERSMRGVSSQKPSGMPGEVNRQQSSRHLPNPGKVNGYDEDGFQSGDLLCLSSIIRRDATTFLGKGIE